MKSTLFPYRMLVEAFHLNCQCLFASITPPERKNRKPTWPDRVGEGWGVGRVEVVEYGKADSKNGKMQEDDADTLEPRKPIPNFRRTRATDALLFRRFCLFT